jgi:hypothetical protein
MNTENYGHNMNITICNEKTNKHVTLFKIDHSLDIREKMSMVSSILRHLEWILGTVLERNQEYEKGYIVNLSEDQLITLIKRLNSILQLCDMLNEEEGQVVAEKAPLLDLQIINELKTLL